MKKRILIFSLVYYPRFIGGAEVAIKEITDRFGSDIEFDMVTLRKHAPAFERIGNVNIYRVGWPWQGSRAASSKIFPLAKTLFPFTSLWKANKLHRQRPYDAVWGMMAAYAGFGALFFKLLHPRVPFLLTLQEGDPIPYILHRVRFVHPLFKRIFTKADIVQAISNYLGEFSRTMGFAGPLRVIPNGVDVARFSQGIAPEKRAALRAEFGATEADTLLVTTSRLVRKNAVDDVIRALPKLPHAHFAILGTGPDELELRRLAEKLGVASRVHFKGFVKHEEMPPYLHAADIFIRPSRSEGMGNSFVEAMAAGIPVIATQEGGIADFLFDAKGNPEKEATGWAVDKDSPEGIVAAVRDITAHPEEVQKTAANAKKLVQDHYEWDLVAKEMRALFDELTESLRLVVATPLYPPEIGGPATYAKALETGLLARGILVKLVKFGEVRRLPKLIRHYAYYRRVRAALKGADAVLALDPVSVGLPAQLAAKRAGKPLFVKVVGDYAWEQGRQRFGVTEDLDTFVTARQKSGAVRRLQRIETRVVAAALRVIVPSEYLKRIVAAWGIPGDKISVIYNAVPMEAPGVVPREVAALQRPLVVAAGRLVPWKHIDGVIDAVAKVNASLAVVGDGPLRGELERRAIGRLSDRALFTGELLHKDTLAVLKTADVFVLNSSYEGLSHLLIEALSLGVPIVATKAGGNSEVVADGETGLLVPVGDTAALAGALARLLGDEALKSRFSEKARAFSARFSEEAMLTATATLLREEARTTL